MSAFPALLAGQGAEDDSALTLARRMVEEGHYTEAAAELERVCRQPSANAPCRRNLALAYLKSGRIADARAVASEIAAAMPDAETFHLLAAIEEEDGKHEAAARALYRAAELAPSEENLFALGSYLIEYQANDAALDMLAYGSERYPRSARLKVALGIVLYASSRYEEATEAFCAAVDLDPRDPRALEFLGKIVGVAPTMAMEVRARLARFVEQYPDSAAAHYYYALSLWEETDQSQGAVLGEVESLLKRALAVEPSLPEARYQLGLLYERREEDERAIAAYETLIAAKPDYERAYYRLGQLYMRHGRREEARKALDRHRQIRAAQEGGRP